MADIFNEMQIIANYWMGYDIRLPIHDAIENINDQLEAQNEGEDAPNEEANSNG
jgi:hypothetical protein